MHWFYRRFPPSSHIPGNTADRQGGHFMNRYLGLKPQAESCSPFGTKPTPVGTWYHERDIRSHHRVIVAQSLATLFRDVTSWRLNGSAH